MPGPEFFQTPMGREFYCGTMPRLARAIEALAKRLPDPDPWEEIKDLEFNFSDFSPWRELEASFVERIPADELPLMVNEEWESSEAAARFKERLAAGA